MQMAMLTLSGSWQSFINLSAWVTWVTLLIWSPEWLPELKVKLLLCQAMTYLVHNYCSPASLHWGNLYHTVSTVEPWASFRKTHKPQVLRDPQSISEPSWPSDQIRSVAQSCPTLCDPMNCSTPGLPVHHQLPEFIQTHVHRVSDAIQPSHPLAAPSPPPPNPSQHQSLFQWVNPSHEMAKVLEFQL